ncbi:MAG: NUDIX domain-containing protein [Flavobacteriales bacterium]|nr:NUDIX domain-containing protein [Flavobacteriales bacterium]
MAQKYEVHIGGKPLVFGELPNFIDTPANWLAMRMDDAEELAAIARNLAQRPGLAGIFVFHHDVEAAWNAFKAGYKLVHAAGGAVSDEQGRLLAIHRLGMWDLPKGKVEKDESIEAAALREVEEECGLIGVELQEPLCETWHTYERNGRQHLKCTHWFHMRADGEQALVPQKEEDIQEARWMDAEGVLLLKREGWPSLLPVVNAWEAATRDPA